MKKCPTILTVDDEIDIRNSVKQVLQDEDCFEVFTAKSGNDCLKKLEKLKPDLILLDILMPGLTTKEILKEFRERKIKIPIIFLSVVRLSETLKKDEIKGNMVDYVEKPFVNKDLVARVKKALKM
jgi:DNA-binding response OmpR family regulator